MVKSVTLNKSSLNLHRLTSFKKTSQWNVLSRTTSKFSKLLLVCNFEYYCNCSTKMATNHSEVYLGIQSLWAKINTETEIPDVIILNNLKKINSPEKRFNWGEVMRVRGTHNALLRCLSVTLCRDVMQSFRHQRKKFRLRMKNKLLEEIFFDHSLFFLAKLLSFIGLFKLFLVSLLLFDNSFERK